MTSDTQPTRTTDPRDPQRWTRAQLVEPSAAGYVHVGVSSGPWRGPVPTPRRARRHILRRMHLAQQALRTHPSVARVDVFRALLRPPGGGDRVPGGEQRSVAYDAVMLVETSDLGTAEDLLEQSPLADAVGDLRQLGTDVVAFAGANVRRIGPVDHDRQGVFLFNYFTAADIEDNLFAWQYTAGWFQDQTGLDNSTVIQPADASVPYRLVNHCRWDNLRDVVPSLALKPSFRRFVLRVFAENGVAPHPILYRLHRPR